MAGMEEQFFSRIQGMNGVYDEMEREWGRDRQEWRWKSEDVTDFINQHIHTYIDMHMQIYAVSICSLLPDTVNNSNYIRMRVNDEWQIMWYEAEMT